jgi:hypothetical protein
MLPDLHAHRREGVVFVLGLDHHASLSAAEKRLAVCAVNRVCMRTSLLDRVLAGEVQLGTCSTLHKNRAAKEQLTSANPDALNLVACVASHQGKSPAREPGQNRAHNLRSYDSSRTKVTSMFTL